MRVPTKKLDIYCDLNKFKPATRRFVTEVFRQCKDYGTRYILDLKGLNQKLGKFFKSYCLATLRLIAEEITNSAFIKVVRKHNNYLYEVELVPFEAEIYDPSEELSEEELTSYLTEEDVNETTEKNCSFEKKDEKKLQEQKSENPYRDKCFEKTGIKQQQLIQINKLCLAEGIKYRTDVLIRFAKKGVDVVRQGISFLRVKSLSGKIRSKSGFLIDAIEKGYYKDHLLEAEDNLASISFLLSEKKSIENRLADLGIFPSSSKEVDIGAILAT